MYTTDSTLGEKCNLIVRDLRSPADPIRQIDVTSQKFSKVTSAIWGPLEDTIITGHETGEIAQWDLRKGELSMKTRPHAKQVMDLQRDRDSTCFISASKVSVKPTKLQIKSNI